MIDWQDRNGRPLVVGDRVDFDGITWRIRRLATHMGGRATLVEIIRGPGGPDAGGARIVGAEAIAQRAERLPRYDTCTITVPGRFEKIEITVGFKPPPSWAPTSPPEAPPAPEVDRFAPGALWVGIGHCSTDAIVGPKPWICERRLEGENRWIAPGGYVGDFGTPTWYARHARYAGNVADAVAGFLRELTRQVEATRPTLADGTRLAIGDLVGSRENPHFYWEILALWPLCVVAVGCPDGASYRGLPLDVIPGWKSRLFRLVGTPEAAAGVEAAVRAWAKPLRTARYSWGDRLEARELNTHLEDLALRASTTVMAPRDLVWQAYGITFRYAYPRGFDSGAMAQAALDARRADK